MWQKALLILLHGRCQQCYCLAAGNVMMLAGRLGEGVLQTKHAQCRISEQQTLISNGFRWLRWQGLLFRLTCWLTGSTLRPCTEEQST